MLPLWIIDLNGDSKRSTELRNKVYALCRQENPDDTVATVTRDESNRFSKDVGWHYTWLSRAIVKQKADALREAHDAGEEDEVLTDDFDWELFAIRNILISEGQKFMQKVKKSKAVLQGPINMVVIADITDPFSRDLFPSFSALVFHDKGHIIPFHVHYGLRILGMLYIPTDVHTRGYEERQSILRCIEELETARKIDAVSNYYRVLIHQDVQHITQKYYPALNEQQLAELEFQYLLNLFYATDRFNTVLDHDGAPDNYYISMGAASVFYDSKNQRQKELKKVLSELIDHLKENVENDNIEDVDEVSGFRFASNDDPEDIVSEDICTFKNHDDFTEAEADSKESETITDVEGYLKKGCRAEMTYELMEPPSPNPITDFYKNSIKTEYYEKYLKFLPARIQQHVIEWIRPLVNQIMTRIRRNRRQLFKNFEQQLHQGTADLLSQRTAITEKTGALFRIERHLRLLRQYLESQRGKVQLWMQDGHRPIIEPDSTLREYMDDVKNSKDPEESKRQIMDSLKKKLEHEPTIWGMLVHTFFLGILCVLAFLPLMQFVSMAGVVNLGDVEKYAVPWSILLFNIPLICQCVWLYCHFRSVKTDEKRLQAYYLYEGQVSAERLFVREATQYYEDAIKLVDKYIERTKKIKQAISADFVKDKYPLEIPPTMFNQPVLGGKFNGKTFFEIGEEGSDDEMVINDIAVDQEVKRINQLTTANYYQLISECANQHFHDINEKGRKISRENLFSCLYDGLDIDGGSTKLASTTSEEETAEQQEPQEEVAPAEPTTIADYTTNEQQNFNARVGMCVRNIYNYLESRIANRGDDSIGDLLTQLKYENEEKMDVKPFEKMSYTSGQITADDEEEYANIKCNKDVSDLLTLKPHNTEVQVINSPHFKLYKKYLFITRWRGYNTICLNRMLPEEQLDLSQPAAGPADYPASSLLLFALKKDSMMSEQWDESFCSLFNLKDLLDAEPAGSTSSLVLAAKEFVNTLETKV